MAVDGEVVPVVQRPDVIGRTAAMRHGFELWARRSRLRASTDVAAVRLSTIGGCVWD